MEQYISQLNKKIEPLRAQIINHPAYKSIKTIEDLRIFMQFHIYAVWDFMSLLKTLQQNLTCTSVPWFPKGNPQTRHLINEIVAGEEADLDLDGHYKSHFELYMSAMQQCGAATEEIDGFLAHIQKTGDFNEAYKVVDTPLEARQFVDFTFGVINSGKPHLQAAIFTFGREDLIPGMFLTLVHNLDAQFPGEISILKYYLERHIAVDGDHHSHLAIQMTAQLCGENPILWAEAEAAVIASLQQRIVLWNGVQRMLQAVSCSKL
jgi:hypothetical protein